MWNYRSEVIFNTYFQHVNILKRFICFISRVWMFYLYVCTCTTCVWRSEEGIGHLGSTIIGDCGPLCGFWEPNPTLLQEQQVLLTSKPSLQILMICSSLYLHYYELNILLFFEGLATQAFSKPKKIIEWPEAKLSSLLVLLRSTRHASVGCTLKHTYLDIDLIYSSYPMLSRLL